MALKKAEEPNTMPKADNEEAEITYSFPNKECIEIRCGEDMIRFSGDLGTNEFLVFSGDYLWVKQTGAMTKEELMQRVKNYAESQGFKISFVSDVDLDKAYFQTFIPNNGLKNPLDLGSHPIIIGWCASGAASLIFGYAAWRLLETHTFPIFSILTIVSFALFLFSPLYYLLARRREKKIERICTEIYRKRIEEILDIKNRGKIMKIWKEQMVEDDKK